jgi:hypothetical protein
MKIFFVVGTFGSGRMKVFKKLLSAVKQDRSISAIGNGIGGTAGSEAIGGNDNITLEICLYQLSNAFSMFSEKDYYIFTGTGLTKHIKEIMAVYPDAGIYMLRRTDPDLELTDENVSKRSTKSNATEEWVRSFNAEIRSELESYADELGITWRAVNSPVFTLGTTPNWADDPSSADTNIEIAGYNIN